MNLSPYDSLPVPVAVAYFLVLVIWFARWWRYDR